MMYMTIHGPMLHLSSKVDTMNGFLNLISKDKKSESSKHGAAPVVLGFVALLGFEFLEASAYAKIINCITNISALYVFISQGNYILEIAIIMAISNVLGSIIGTRMAILKGNQFIRKLFLLVVCIMIIRYGYDVFFS